MFLHILTISLLCMAWLSGETSCAFCNPVVIQKQAVFESQNFWVLADYCPINFGHVLIVPKKHVQRLDEIDPQLGNELLTVHQRVSNAFHDLLKIDDTTIIEKNGPGAGQSVPHVHFHVIPTKEERWQLMAHLRVFMRILFGSRPASDEELEKVVTLYRDYFHWKANDSQLSAQSGVRCDLLSE